MPKWSILLPTHNRAKTLDFAIQSALLQTQQDFELLIVADGCTDNTKEIVSKFKDSRIKFFDLEKAPNFGYANRNIALKEASGELIAFLAHDDLWFKDHLNLLEKEFNDPKIDLCYTQPLWITPEAMALPSSFNLKNPACLNLFMNKKENAIPAGCFAHRKSCFDKLGYWDESLTGSGDWDMWTRIINNSNFSYIPKATNLHFRAIWKNDENEGHPEIKIWRKLLSEIITTEDIFLPIPQDVLEQEVYLKKIITDDHYATTLRKAIDILKDQFIWNYVKKELSLNEVKFKIKNLENDLEFELKQKNEIHKDLIWHKEKYDELLEERKLLRKNKITDKISKWIRK